MVSDKVNDILIAVVSSVVLAVVPQQTGTYYDFHFLGGCSKARWIYKLTLNALLVKSFHAINQTLIDRIACKQFGVASHEEL